MKRTPIKRRRETLRRGELTSAQKESCRALAFARAHGRCELRIDATCMGFVPLEGGLRERGHLVHLRNKRMYGWGAENLAWGCARCHLDLMHVKGIQMPKTYTELKQQQSDAQRGKGDDSAGSE